MPEIGVDTSAAEAYASALVPGLFGAWARDAISWAGISQGDQVLDVACGPGVATRPAARKAGPAGRVVGVDSDPGMIAVAKAASVDDKSVRLEWRCASAQGLPFEDKSFDIVLCLQGLQFFPDRILALREMARVLKSGGRLLAIVWRSLDYCKGYQAMVQVLEKRGIDAAPARKPFSLGDEQVLKEAAENGGFRNVRVRVEKKLAEFPSAEAFLEAVARGAPSSRFALAKVAPDDRAAFVSEVSEILGPYAEGGALRFPMESYVLEARL